jgi:hypothetical protein
MTILGLSILRRDTKGLVVKDVKGVENMDFQ